MNLEELNYYFTKFKFGDDSFHNLMKKRIREILLISTVYDAYVLEKDGRLSEQIYGEYRQLDLSTAPRITTATFSEDIFQILKNREYDLIIITMRINDTSSFDLGKSIKDKYPNQNMLLLLNRQSYPEIVNKRTEYLKIFNDIFLWRGDPKLFIAMIKSLEDKFNVDFDTKIGNVRVILVVEENINYFSLFLPIFYAESMRLTQELIESELQDSNKRLRMRGRPKVLLVHNYNNAIEMFNKYKEYIICVISNVYMKVDQEYSQFGGIKLIREIRDQSSDLPILMQSADLFNEKESRKLNVQFLYKGSNKLLADIRTFVINNLGFGDFVFRNNEGQDIGRAKSMYDFEKQLASIPEESLLYHASRNHFSAWLMAHGKVKIAQQIRFLVASDFLDVDDIRKFLTNTIKTVREQRNRGKVVTFDNSIFTEEEKIVQLTEGSLGGKGRGLAFLNAFLITIDLNKEFQDITIKLPKTAIIGTNEFDSFLENNRINIEKLIQKQDNEIEEEFLRGSLSQILRERLKILLAATDQPLAIRSSGLLEDSQSQPFAGIYRTYMLPNNNPNFHMRLQQLENAIKIIFSTPFQKNPRTYIESNHYQIEEEKMAVVIQEIGGSDHGKDLFYPTFSGAAQSYNFYPATGMSHSDGIVALAAGLGKTVVDGERALRYCPRHPRINILEPKDIVENNQREYYAIDLNRSNFNLQEGEKSTLKKIKITSRNFEETLKNLSSVWDYKNLNFIDGKFAKGPRVLTFRNIIHYNSIPLSEILLRILEIGEVGLGVPVEIEFAVDYISTSTTDYKPTFYLLQIRPLSISKEYTEVDIGIGEENSIILRSSHAMGHGVINHIQDIVFIDPLDFDNTDTMSMVAEIEKINISLKQLEREYILIGAGRWGTSDRFLGIPVKWTQINKARIIIETNLEHFVVEASQGSHFFHNLIAMNIGYFTVGKTSTHDFIDWNWLKNQETISRTKYFYHIRLADPVVVKVNGRKGNAVILKYSGNNNS